MRWNKDKYQITVPLDNRKHRNVGVVRSSPGIAQYITACQVIDTEYTAIAYPATISMDCQTTEMSDDEANNTTPKITQKGLDQEMEGKRSVKPTEEEQMREQIFKDKEPEPITYEEEEDFEKEDLHTYAQDTQEYMHWHYRLNHPTHTVMTRMAKLKMLPKEITRIVKTMVKQQVKPPMCNDCCGAKATRKPWRGKG
jgi:hypothetical protein